MKLKLFNRYKNSITVFIAFFIAFDVSAAIFISPKAPDINANSYIVIDHNSNKIIAANNSLDRRAPASLTKLMTAYVVFQLIKDGRANLEDDVTISENAWRTGGSKSFIEVGNTIKLEVLLKAMIIQSGNDAAVALAEHIAGTEGTFAAYMNEYAVELGMTNSRFENASGLPHDEQYTTAHDMAIMAQATIRDFPDFYRWYSEKEFTYNDIKQRNRNKLLWSDNTVDGLKTGYTERAGYCLVTSANRVGMRLISVILGSPSVNDRTAQTQKILDYGFRFFETQSISGISKKMPILKSTKKTLNIGIDGSTFLTLARGQFKLTSQAIQLNNKLVAPINEGDIVGKLLITFEGESIAELPLIALEDAEEAGFFSRIIDTIKMLF
jgi:D-alanyl-D-alanine carboxypeptidase (penicillin-binding protein 5/6)